MHILRKNGEVLVCGTRFSGGSSSKKDPSLLLSDSNIKQIFCSSSHAVLLMKNGEVLTFGENKLGGLATSRRRVPTIAMNAQDVRQVCCGGDGHTLVLLRNGQLWGWVSKPHI